MTVWNDFRYRTSSEGPRNWYREPSRPVSNDWVWHDLVMEHPEGILPDNRMFSNRYQAAAVEKQAPHAEESRIVAPVPRKRPPWRNRLLRYRSMDQH